MFSYVSLHCATPRSAISRKAAGISTFGISNFGISNFGISNAPAAGLLVFILGGVVVVASAMTRVLDFNRCSWAVSLENLFSLESFFLIGLAARCALPDILVIPRLNAVHLEARALHTFK